MDHDWKQVGWEYDDDFYECRNCGQKSHSRRGTPPVTPEECRKAGVLVCGPLPAALIFDDTNQAIRVPMVYDRARIHWRRNVDLGRHVGPHDRISDDEIWSAVRELQAEAMEK